jgi:hypothetical protein
MRASGGKRAASQRRTVVIVEFAKVRNDDFQGPAVDSDVVRHQEEDARNTVRICRRGRDDIRKRRLGEQRKHITSTVLIKTSSENGALHDIEGSASSLEHQAVDSNVNVALL